MKGRICLKKRLAFFLIFALCLSLCGCGTQPGPTIPPAPQEAEPSDLADEAAAGQEAEELALEAQDGAEDGSPAESEETAEEKAPVLLYMGHASLRIVTAEGKVIYIDPYAGNAYDLPADLILVTHEHFDHSTFDRVKSRSEDCRTITWKEALEGGKLQSFDLAYVSVEAVEAGNNRFHDLRKCVGYVLRFPNGVSVYVSGDTSTTAQMAEMADMQIDYAFFCCDGVYNMGPAEAAKCAELVGAKHNIPYHTASTDSGKIFDPENAEKFDAPDRLILSPGDEIELK